VIGPVTKLPVALCKPTKHDRWSDGEAKGETPKSTNVLMEMTTKRYGEKEEQRDFSPFLRVDLQANSRGIGISRADSYGGKRPRWIAPISSRLQLFSGQPR
jgi:hypothetical protein